jgi:hypothetical protein
MNVVSRHPFLFLCLLVFTLIFRLEAQAQDQAPAPIQLAMASSPPAPTIDESAVKLNDYADVKTTQNSKKEEGDGKSSSVIVLELYNAYMESQGLTEGYNKNVDKHFYFSQQPVSQPKTSPDFGKARVLAFDRAYHDALKRFVASTSTMVRSDVARALFDNTSTDAGEFEEELAKGKSGLEAMVAKAVALGDAVLSSKLKEYGVDPDKYKAAPPDRKKVILSDAFSRRIVERSSKMLSGVVPIQTFTGESSSGQANVGVLIMYSSKLEAIAKSLARDQKPKVTTQGPPLTVSIPLNDPAKLLDLLGVRVLFDEQGPVVVSYGQWSSSYNGQDERMQDRHRNTAFDQAGSQATAALSEFLNTSFTSEELSTVGELFEKSKVLRGETGEVEEVNTEKLVDIRTEVSKRKTNARLQGANTLKRWVYTTPDGHEIVGVVKAYSFGSIEAAKQTFAKPQDKPSKGPTPQGNGKSSGRKSQDQMNINDF